MILESERREVWDHATLLWSVGNDVDFFVELVRTFLDAYPRTLASIAAYLGEGDRNLPAIEAGAHALQDSLSELAAEAACEAAGKLEMAAREGNLTGARDAFQVLQDALSELTPAFGRIGKQLVRSEF